MICDGCPLATAITNLLTVAKEAAGYAEKRGDHPTIRTIQRDHLRAAVEHYERTKKGMERQ